MPDAGRWRAPGGALRRVAAAILIGVLVAMPIAPRADEASLRDAAELPGAAMWLSYGSPGLVLAVVRGSDAVVLGYGETAKGSRTEPNGRTIVRIGSISKVFAGHLLASLVAEGRVRLADPAARYLGGSALPEREGRPITLIDLVTHSAGLPRELPGEPAPGANPFERFTWPRYRAYLATARLATVPGRAAAYSNLGFGILGEALAGAAGSSYADLVASRVTRPLGMADTVLRLDAAQGQRLMTGHSFDGTPMQPFEVTDAMAASAGLYATADDMVRFMRWHLDRGDPAGDAVRVVDHALYLQRDGLAAAVGFDEAGRMDAIGLAWIGMMPDGPRPFVIQKAGAIQGFMSYVALAPTRGVGVFVAVNQFNFGAFSQVAAAVNGLIAELAPR